MSKKITTTMKPNECSNCTKSGLLYSSPSSGADRLCINCFKAHTKAWNSFILKKRQEDQFCSARSKIFKEISEERDYQNNKWGFEFDKRNTVNDWTTFVTQYMSDAARMNITLAERRKYILKAAALTVAALENFDVNGKFTKPHYDNYYTDET